MIPENVQHRRGEPVILTYESGDQRQGTIEWGDVDTHNISVYLEHGGREVIYKGDAWPKLRTDPGGQRPVWDSLP
jgi:hypothetical protein